MLLACFTIVRWHWRRHWSPAWRRCSHRAQFGSLWLSRFLPVSTVPKRCRWTTFGWSLVVNNNNSSSRCLCRRRTLVRFLITCTCRNSNTLISNVHRLHRSSFNAWMCRPLSPRITQRRSSKTLRKTLATSLRWLHFKWTFLKRFVVVVLIFLKKN